jgi:TM2 domain-containing membrane protein YozV
MNRNQKKILGIVTLLLLTSSNFLRLKGNENIRPIQYLSLLVIGGLIAFLLYEVIKLVKGKGNK